MPASERLDVTFLPGARKLLEAHQRELPQRDDLCGAFCGALALHAAGIEDYDGGPLDQDAMALAAGSIVSRSGDHGSLPLGEHGRRDYRVSLPQIDDAALAGTTPAGLRAAVTQLSGGRLAGIPYAGPWTPATLGGLFDVAAELADPVTLVANLATRHLWGAGAEAQQLLEYLFAGAQDGPTPDWDVGHFACLIGRVRGPAGTLYGIADTYPSLGRRGVHLQPQERLAAAIERRDMPAGGVIVIASENDLGVVQAHASALGLVEDVWDNGTVTKELLT
jgi:uncharacterized protein DUF6885